MHKQNKAEHSALTSAHWVTLVYMVYNSMREECRAETLSLYGFFCLEVLNY